MVEPDNLVLKYLRAILADLVKMAGWMQVMSAEMTAMRQHLAVVVTIQESDHSDIAALKIRLDRIERRLELVDEI